MPRSSTTVTLEPGPEAVSVARDAVTEAVRGRVDEDQLDTLRLLVSEVVTNSIRHSRTRREVELALCLNGEVHVAVTDDGPGFAPRDRAGAPDEPNGWGLFLVDCLSSHWGVVRNGRTCVWFGIPAH